ncbi:hypothetical protein BCY91_05735 [Pelobium manganitolerans]|uniref:Uncharacterized protein n=1 Tax=Pelobium manganitolerans TaxID=1842495 RepID=A0A419S4Y5_9SPHI|nr:hypothetical protein [Pelobium manganitolerans]RKD15030.1 hypothetical protein BCY91_05735 [Pelobium manganitolerans]
MNSANVNKKAELIKWLLTVEDEFVLDQVAILKMNDNRDWWTLISEEERTAIENGLRDADDNKLVTHSEVKKLYEKWL